ncbi:cupin domain-containing protein [Pseudofrankia inefficax]|uniref:ChrR-like cupin domain-containing protein n=1 Tax=Pseudofrankia inefficax (strain DSM 45817 / CECT 9037 / DDB 130130 / EuI1c) TaxID=298654 RepID=E3J917_PSEI1|nr:hypothetical protein [Pseudofrankia inefficax]ADP80896.1 hypothetical protein FraEuI1c_2870 [Pseudofrankia inefficax]
MAIYSMDQAEYWVEPESFIQFEDMRTSHRLLGEDPGSPRVVVMDMKPGFVIPRHAHGCERFEVIVQGSLYSGDDELRVGTIMLAHPGEVYGPKVAGPEGCMTVEVFARNDTSASEFELDDGTFFTFSTTADKEYPPNLARREWIEEHQRKAREGAAALAVS